MVFPLHDMETCKGDTPANDTPNSHKHENTSHITCSMGKETCDVPETLHDPRINWTKLLDDYTSSPCEKCCEGVMDRVLPKNPSPNPDLVVGTTHMADAIKLDGEKAITSSTVDGILPNTDKTHKAVANLHCGNGGGEPSIKGLGTL